MQEHARLLGRLSAEHLRHLARPFFAAGWTPADLLHALDHDTRGRQHGYSAGVRSPAGWVRSRLAGWLGPDAVPLPSRSQRVAEARRQVLAEQAARRARDTAARAQVADYAVHAARAREMLNARPGQVPWRREIVMSQYVGIRMTTVSGAFRTAHTPITGQSRSSQMTSDLRRKDSALNQRFVCHV